MKKEASNIESRPVKDAALQCQQPPHISNNETIDVEMNDDGDDGEERKSSSSDPSYSEASDTTLF